MALAVVALGSNLGPRAALLDAGLRRLGALPGTRVLARSRWAPSPPEAAGDGGPYLNGVALLETALPPERLHRAARRIERELGRAPRPQDRARPLDLDLIFLGALRRETGVLTVPHPRYRRRPFVLDPARALAPRLCDPRCGRPLRDLELEEA
ncbi:MAG: 2-amino-4-hydroxy-6-hydroxymethyldihydropteridine diphosphokinase [Planctomycetota bacterium]